MSTTLDERVEAILELVALTPGELLRGMDEGPAHRWWEDDRRACLGAASDLFFPKRGDSRSMDAAISYCSRCEVRTSCLLQSLVDHDMHGVFGGLSERRRSRVHVWLNRRQRGPPDAGGDARCRITNPRASR